MERARNPTLDYPKNVPYSVYHTYVQQVRNYEGIQRKELHFGTRHRIEHIKTKPTQKNNLTTLTLRRVARQHERTVNVHLNWLKK